MGHRFSTFELFIFGSRAKLWYLLFFNNSCECDLLSVFSTDDDKCHLKYFNFLFLPWYSVPL